MEFLKSLNNNAALADDEKHHEYVVIETGISFGQHPEDPVDETKIQCRFTVDDTLTDELASLNQVQPVAIRVTEQLVRAVENQQSQVQVTVELTELMTGVMYISMDTVELNGKGFKTLVKKIMSWLVSH